METRREELGAQPFGGHVEEVDLAEGRVVQGDVDLLAAHVGGERPGPHTPGAQGLDLVAHQCDEGRDHQAEPAHGEARHLETQAFAASSG